MSPIAEEQYPDEKKAEQVDGAWVNAELLREVLEEGATVIRVHVQRAVAKGENYMSVLYRTRVEYKVSGSDELQVKNLIVKGLPSGDFILTYLQEVGFFRREAAIYGDVLPAMYAFADEKLQGSLYKRISPRFHKTSRPDTVILEDLKPDGFVMASRRHRLDLAHAKLVVQNLARLHALSLAFDERHPGVISQYHDTLFGEQNRERLVQFFSPQINTVVEQIRKWNGFEKLADKLQNMQCRVVDKLIEITKPERSVRNALLHGDCWVNNILFKYSEMRQPVDACFVDFQITRYGSPAFDLNYFLFSSLSTDIRSRYMNTILQEYCDEFETCARKLEYGGSLITFEEMREEVERKLYFGFIAVIMTMPVVLADPDNPVDLSALTDDEMKKGDSRIFEKVYASAAFREAFENLLPYFDERGVLD